MKEQVSIILAVLLLGGVVCGAEAAGAPKLSAFRVAPSYFIPNTPAEQTGKRLVGDEAVVAFVQTQLGRVLFTPTGAYIGMASRGPGAPPETPGFGRLPGERFPVDPADRGKFSPDQGPAPARTVVLGVGFGTDHQHKGGVTLTPRLAEPMEGRVNFFVGARENWRSNIPVYRKLAYDNVWPGIDVEYLGYMDRLEYRLTVHPGADPSAVVMTTGAETLTLDESSNLTAGLEGAALRMSRPVAWQERDGQRIPVEVAFRPLSGPGGRYGFDVGAFDPSLDLVIDPFLSWSTFLGEDGLEESGGGHIDQINCIAVDADGNAYVVGYTASSNFPTTAGAYDTTLNDGAGYEAFVSKLNPAGSALLYSTFLGGSSYDTGNGIAVDAGGNAYVAGSTKSADFPTSAGAYDTTFNGSYSNAFVTKLNAAGSALVCSTFLGGSESYRQVGSEGLAITVDASGNAYVTGSTDSSDFPTTEGAYDTSFNGNYIDSFVTKLKSDWTALEYSTFLGGSASDYGRGIAVNTAGNAYVTGDTSSPDFPTSDGAYDSSQNGLDVFITQLNAAGSALVYSTFLGGSQQQRGRSIAVDAADNAYVTGDTNSTNFPTTPGAFGTVCNGYLMAFITKLNAAGSGLVYSTFLGGNFQQRGRSIAVDAEGNACVTGETNSDDFPTTAGALDTSFNGYIDAFITKIHATGSTLIYSTFLGGSRTDRGWGIALDNAGNAYVAGGTDAADFPVTEGSYDPNYNGGGDAFITKLNVDGSALVYSTYLGGGGQGEHGLGLATDGNGAVYLTGFTFSPEFPTTAGAYDRTQNWYADAFVTKLASGGTSLAYSTYLGGTADDSGNSIAVDAAGNAYVTGNTYSSDFPTTAGAYDRTHNGGCDTFITKLNTGGSTLVYSTLLGGSGGEIGTGIVVGSGGNAYVTGYTVSSDLPTTVGAYDQTYNGGNDGFVTMLDTGGSTLVYSTFLGGSGTEYSNGIAKDVAGNVFVTGYTESADFPTTPGAFDLTLDGGNDGFVTGLNAAGSALTYSTFLGGGSDDESTGIAVDAFGNAYVTGYTNSIDYPTTAGSFDTVSNGLDEIFVTKFSISGSTLVYSTFLGGSGDDRSHGLAVDATRNAYVTGYTCSADFPITPGAFDATFNGGTYDAFVTKLNTDGSGLAYSTFLGGNGAEFGRSITVDAGGNAYLTGETSSPDFPTTAGAYDTINATGPDVFVLMMAIGSGDLNHDGVVNAADLSILSAYLAGVDLPPDTTSLDCELVADGVINAADLCWLQNRVAGNVD